MLRFARPMLRLMFRATRFASLCNPCCDFSRPMLRVCAPHVATSRDACCDFARSMLRVPCCDFPRRMLRFCATHVANLRDATHVETLRDQFSAKLLLCATQVSCGSMEFRSQKVHFGYPFRSQHKSWTSSRDQKELKRVRLRS